MVKVILSVLFFGLTAQASCPDLTGTFVNKGQTAEEGEVTLNVSQSENSGVTTYNVAVKIVDTEGAYEFDMSFIADGVERTSGFSDAEGKYEYTSAFSCGDNALNEKFVESYTDNKGTMLDKAAGDNAFTINAGGDFSYASEFTDMNGAVTKEETVYKRQ